ncbi:unnamed protein product [Bathycoccus prasinos]
MREPLTKTKTKTKKKEASRATLEKDDAQTDFSVKERIETAMMEVLGKRGLEKTRFMDATRDVAVKLMKESKVQIEQNGEVLRGIQSAKDLKGRIRLRLVEEKKK